MLATRLVGRAIRNCSSTCAVTAASGDKTHGEAGMDVIDTGDILRWRLRAAPLLIRGLVVVHHQFLHLYEALDDWNHPKVHLWHLENAKVKSNIRTR